MTGVGVRVDVELGSGVADSVGVGESVEVDGEGVGVGETVVVPCCIEEGRVVSGSAADWGNQKAPQERASPTSSKGRVGWRTRVFRVMIAPCDPQIFCTIAKLMDLSNQNWSTSVVRVFVWDELPYKWRV